MAITMPIQSNQMKRDIFSFFLNTEGPKNNMGTMNHNFAKRNLNEVNGCSLLKEVMKIQQR